MNRNKVIPNYFGSKNGNGVYQFIINRMPPHRIYIEGFLGSGIIMQQKKPAELNIGFDLSAAVIDKFNRKISDHCHFFINGDFVAEVKKVLSMFNEEVDHKDVFIYLDPPYLQSTRTSGQKYNHELTTMDHIDVLNFVTGLDCNIAISCYDNDLYTSILQKWNKENYKSQTRAGQRIETLYMNYEVKELHDSKFLGVDFTDRQRIKRKVARQIEKFKKLPPLERAVLIDEINNVFR